jgi:hypothetical protein
MTDTVTERAFFTDLDRALNTVINEHFDLYFDESEVKTLLSKWVEAKRRKGMLE